MLKFNAYSVVNYSSSSPTFTNVIVNASGGGQNYCVEAINTSSVTMTNKGSLEVDRTDEIAFRVVFRNV